MNRHLLMIVTSHGTLGKSGLPTGAWLEEICAPLQVFRDAELTVTVASPLGGRPPIDPNSADFETGAVPDLDTWLEGTQALAKVDPGRHDAVLLVGGHGTMWDFPGNPDLAAIIAAVAARGVVAAVCHGSAGLIDATGIDGKPLVSGRTITAFSDAEENMAGADAVIPFSLQQRLAELDATVEVAEPFSVHVRRDGNLITGQNPASSAALAAATVDAMRGVPE
ncbi:putative intracellular protease/amidase [Lipingzhangella halophila]|uniref:Putative intracellular protease/amidase n=1 Tax=Lipingzhangella halophila TaxID=1783352 RepID=A0A7W7RNZ2_9ACTN|nr:type 1 glutamine amidotransferase domain-containing protein [Lipingzhangella halophila]MBB4935466.1 putative intracellular protease/amidase [Lipingzhangella halophila]